MPRPKLISSPLAAKAFTLDPAGLAANVAAVQTVTVKGLRVKHPTMVWGESLELGLVISNAYCSAKDTLKFKIANVTAAPVDAASQTFYVVQF
jgi:hypothetical protein